MSVLSIRLPDSLHDAVKKISKEEHTSINQFITNALAEKLTALKTEEYLQSRSKKGDKQKYLNVLSKVKDAKPEKEDIIK